MASLNDFEIIEEIGEGGFGIVYLAKDLASGRLVALKQVKYELRDSALLEYDILKNADCGKGVVCYRGYFVDEVEGVKYLFLIMDYYQGKDLYKLIESDYKFSAPEVIYICRRLLKALRWLHERGIVHRDIKGENIIITSAGPVLIDFGLACQVKDSKVVKYTCAKKVGTLDTLAPELEFLLFCDPDGGGLAQKLFPEDIYLRADVWSLGLVFKDLVELGFSSVDPVVSCGKGQGSRWSRWLEKWSEKNVELQTLYPAFDIQPSLQEMILGLLEPDYSKRLTLDEALALTDQAEKELAM